MSQTPTSRSTQPRRPRRRFTPERAKAIRDQLAKLIAEVRAKRSRLNTHALESTSKKVAPRHSPIRRNAPAPTKPFPQTTRTSSQVTRPPSPPTNVRSSTRPRTITRSSTMPRSTTCNNIRQVPPNRINRNNLPKSRSPAPRAPIPTSSSTSNSQAPLTPTSSAPRSVLQPAY